MESVGSARVDGGSADVARFMMANTAVFASLAIPMALAIGLNEQSVPTAFWTAVGGTGVGLLISLVNGAWSWRRSSHVSYEVLGQSLIVRQRGEVKRSIPCRDIVTFAMTDGVTWKTLYTAVVPPPPWPRAVVAVRVEGRLSSKTLSLPAVAIWRLDRERVQADFRAAIARARC
jgi:hypothetical protein